MGVRIHGLTIDGRTTSRTIEEIGEDLGFPLPIEYTWLKDAPVPLETCPHCHAKPFVPEQRGQVHRSQHILFLGPAQPYCALICKSCRDIVGYESPPVRKVYNWKKLNLGSSHAGLFLMLLMISLGAYMAIDSASGHRKDWFPALFLLFSGLAGLIAYVDALRKEITEYVTMPLITRKVSHEIDDS